MTASPDGKTYTLDDLADALLTADSHRTDIEPFRDYYVPRGEAFKRAFGLVAAPFEDRRRNLGYLLAGTIQSLRSCSSPVAGVLEAPPEFVEFAERFLPEIDRASAEFRRAVRKMLLALLEELVAPGKTTVTAQELKTQGFDPATQAPNPDDYW